MKIIFSILFVLFLNIFATSGEIKHIGTTKNHNSSIVKYPKVINIYNLYSELLQYANQPFDTIAHIYKDEIQKCFPAASLKLSEDEMPSGMKMCDFGIKGIIKGNLWIRLQIQFSDKRNANVIKLGAMTSLLGSKETSSPFLFNDDFLVFLKGKYANHKAVSGDLCCGDSRFEMHDFESQFGEKGDYIMVFKGKYIEGMLVEIFQ